MTLTPGHPSRPTARRRRGLLVVLALALAATPLSLVPLSPGTAAAPARADLRVASVARGSFVAQRGERFSTSAVVVNRGRRSAPPTRVGVLLSRNATRGSGDRFLTGAKVAGLDPGQRRTRAVGGRLPASLATGVWRLLVCADVDSDVRESSETDNCAVWRTFTISSASTPPPTPPPAGPSGGAAAVCGGDVVPYPQGTTPPAGVRFEVGPSDDAGVVDVPADPVGSEFTYIDEYQQTIVTVTNVGTAQAYGVTVQALPCPAGGSPGWGQLSAWTGDVPQAEQCTPSLPAAASCRVSVYAHDVRLGGVRPGYLRVIGSTDVLAVFPVRVTATSRGFMALSDFPGSDDLLGNAPGAHLRVLLRATNVGDRDAVPTFEFDESAGTPDGVFSLDSSWDAPEGEHRCDPMFSAASQTWIGALSPGTSCIVAIDVCSSQSSVDWRTDVVARLPGDSLARSQVRSLHFTTVSGGDPVGC
ncbi:CARDB domain-containing protein [Nocardioides rubriscoriae]|uniref:CARDB domain-containing protein n=1 Tax=Nocardioides rubriscoriae TaxID=642762 RepID=UPI00147970D3|nr:CARDB domain-containing protein [Nocardioides rubriscoriae]